MAILKVLGEDDIVGRVRDKKVWIAFCCADGCVERMEMIVQKVLDLPASSTFWGIGFNCVGIEVAPALAKVLAGKVDGKGLTLVLYPDGERRHGIPFKQSTMTDQDIQRWAYSLKELEVCNEGRLVLGGCCRTDPRYIAALSQL